ncbi:MAG: DUF4363 family protein [Oscillospiraceae bacterium]|nr:DUF4363 family protein [Oscillospiraceae bacterium]
MRALRISAAVLAALFIVCLAAGTAINRRCNGWQQQLAQAESSAAHGHWRRAEAQLTDLQQDWQRAQGPLHMVMEHAEIDKAASLLQRCLLECRQKDAAALRAAAVELSMQLGHIADMERLSAENIL